MNDLLVVLEKKYIKNKWCNFNAVLHWTGVWTEWSEESSLFYTQGIQEDRNAVNHSNLTKTLWQSKKTVIDC